ncbi:unnamed protein product [Toxocara canis]|uniref:TFIIS N-terminal domain-containing protein n=1 Tax=Toxocara canis TaxID=6265 RepID=A0A183V2Z6_TOXCA|nr:unnamed protein product [Toxocara canis]
MGAKYTVVGHTSEGQPIYALQSISHTERPKAQPSQQIYRVADASGQPRYAYALATPTRTVQQQPVRTIAREYYVHSNEVLNEMQATPVLTNVDLTATRGQPEAQASPSSQVTVLQPSLVTSRLKKKAAASEEDQRRSDQMSGSAVAAQAGAIQRFGTLAGWKQMGAWLKNAEKNGDWNRLKLLLSQCAQANLTVELLQANDTPKFVRKLSKTCIDVDVRKVCGDLVLRWKRLIASPPVAAQSEEPKRVGSAKRKTPHPSSADASARIAKKSKEAQEVRKVRVETRKRSEEQKVDNTTTGLQDSAGVETQKETNKVDESPESSQKAESSKSMIDSQKPIGDSSTSAAESSLAVKAEGSAKKSQSVSDKTDKSQPTPKGSSKISEFNMFEKLRQERKEEKRPKRSRTYMAKFRSTGLEGDSDETTAGKSNGSSTGVKKRMPSKGTLDAKKRAEKNAVTSRSAASTSNVPPPITSTPPSEKKIAQSAPAPRVMASNTFMDALMDPLNKKTTAKPAKKKVLLTAAKPLPTQSVMPSVMVCFH